MKLKNVAIRVLAFCLLSFMTWVLMTGIFVQLEEKFSLSDSSDAFVILFLLIPILSAILIPILILKITNRKSFKRPIYNTTDSASDLQGCMLTDVRETAIPIKTESSKQTVSEHRKTKSDLWPFEDKNVCDMTRIEQHERELRIQMYMEAYPFLPFTIGDSHIRRPNTSTASLNMNGRKVVIDALKELSQMMLDCYENNTVLLDELPCGICIPINKILFDPIPPFKIGETAPTFVEYRPFTNAGRQSKKPLSVFFTIIINHTEILDNECHGELVYGIDGNVQEAKVYYFKNNQCYLYEFGVVGRTFIVKKIETNFSVNGKKCYIYNYEWDYILY